MRRGTIIAGRFTLDRRAGSGAMGVVYRADDAVTKRAVALKMLRARGPSFAERFAREAEVLATITHAAIPGYVAHSATDDGLSWLALDWVEGETLQTHLERARALDVTTTLALGRRVAEALALVHRARVVHRDIKPSNLLLAGNDPARVMLTDFGIAHVEAPARKLTATGTALGTPGYMAPEQALGQRRIDARADVFSLGCVLFECVAGRAVFVAEEPLAVMLKVVLEDAPRVASVASVPAAFDALLARMLAKDVERRPAHGADVARELAAVQQGLTPTSTSTSASAPPAALGLGEQRIVSVVLARVEPGNEADFDPEATDADTHVEGLGPSTENISHASELSIAAEHYGGQLAILASGAVAVALRGAGAATDLAVRGARCALALRSAMPSAPMALVTGRVQSAAATGETVPVGELIDRGVALLAAPSTSVRVDDVTAGLLDARFDVRGDATGLVLVAERASSDAVRTLLGRPSPCVGRERELAQLDALFDECVAERSARVVVVTAPPGVGKSRLRFEWLARLKDRSAAQVWLARGDPMRAGSPFGMIALALRHAAGVLDGEPAAVRRRRVRARVARHVALADAPRVADFLSELLGIPADDDASLELSTARRDPVLMGDQIRRAWSDFVAAESARSPLVLVLEDLHWGDLPSVRLVASALERAVDQPLFVLALARDEVQELFGDLWSAHEPERVRLRPLTKRAAEDLVRAQLDASVDATTIDRVVALAAGNAFYLEELVRAVATGKRDALPETVLAMLESRLERLPAEARRVLRAAAVFGQVFWRGGVRALLGGDEPIADLDASLVDLAKRELVIARSSARFPDERELVFRHALLREAVYATLTDADRALGHALAASWLEHVGETDAMVMAEHFERAHAPSKAISWYRKAALAALEGNDLRGTIARADRALACGAEGPMVGALELLRAEAFRWSGDHPSAMKAGLRALALLPRESGTWYRAFGETIFAAAAAHAAPTVLAELAAELPDEAPTEELESAHRGATARAAAILPAYGLVAEGEALFARLARPTKRPLHREAETRVEWALARRAIFVGDGGEGLLRMTRALEGWRAIGNERAASYQQVDYAYALLETGASEAAIAVLEEALATALRLGLPNVLSLARHNLGVALANVGRLAEAERVEAQAIEDFVALGTRRLEGGSSTYLATIRELRGDLEGAERAVRRAIELLEGLPLLAQARARLASILLQQARVDEAAIEAEAAFAMLETAGVVEEGEALIRLVHAGVLSARGQHEQAKAGLAIARQRLFERADRIADRDVRARFLSGVPDHARTLELTAPR
jgi:serine/threonine protein kinase/tetratricopeptide (TPR) repeat protein